jgi:hypothetical protein
MHHSVIVSVQSTYLPEQSLHSLLEANAETQCALWQAKEHVQKTASKAADAASSHKDAAVGSAKKAASETKAAADAARRESGSAK